MLVPSPTYPLYTAVLAKIGATPAYYRTDPARGLAARPRAHGPRGHAQDAGARAHRSQQPDRRGLSRRRAAPARGVCARRTDSSSWPTRSTAIWASMVPCRRWRRWRPTRRSSRTRACRRRTLRRAGAPAWMAVAPTPRLDEALAAIKKLADGRLCSPGPMQYAVTAALTGDRSHQVAFRQQLRVSVGADRGALQRDAVDARRGAPGRVLRDAAGGAAGRQDRRRLRARAAAGHGHPVRARLGLRPAGRRRILPRRVPGVARRARPRSTTTWPTTRRSSREPERERSGHPTPTDRRWPPWPTPRSRS